MNDEFFDDDELMEEFDTIVMTDENGEEVEFAIMDAVEDNGSKYILVIASKDIDEDSPDATILKEICEDDQEITYEVIMDEEEFEKVLEMFQEGNDDYEIDLE